MSVSTLKVDLGAARPMYKGVWLSSVAYDYLNMVYHNQGLWMNVQTPDGSVAGDEPVGSLEDSQISENNHWVQVGSASIYFVPEVEDTGDHIWVKWTNTGGLANPAPVDLLAKIQENMTELAEEKATVKTLISSAKTASATLTSKVTKYESEIKDAQEYADSAKASADAAAASASDAEKYADTAKEAFESSSSIDLVEDPSTKKISVQVSSTNVIDATTAKAVGNEKGEKFDYTYLRLDGGQMSGNIITTTTTPLIERLSGADSTYVDMVRSTTCKDDPKNIAVVRSTSDADGNTLLLGVCKLNDSSTTPVASGISINHNGSSVSASLPASAVLAETPSNDAPDNQIATVKWVKNNLISAGTATAEDFGLVKASTSVPAASEGTGEAGTANGIYANADHKHPTPALATKALQDGDGNTITATYAKIPSTAEENFVGTDEEQDSFTSIDVPWFSTTEDGVIQAAGTSEWKLSKNFLTSSWVDYDYQEFDVSSLNLPNGYIAFKNGLQMAWGTIKLLNGTLSGSVTFEKPFAARPAVFTSFVYGSGSIVVSSDTASGFDFAVTPADASYATLRYFAIGQAAE